MNKLGDWYSYHIFCYDTSQHEEVILRTYSLMENLMENKKISKWFFIRYWRGGPHIRVRYCSNKNINFQDHFKDVIQYIKRNSRIKLTKGQYYASQNIVEENTAIEDLPWYNDGECIEISYEPEFERYGGISIMPFNETLFHLSTDLAAKILKLTYDQKWITKTMFSIAFSISLIEQLIKERIIKYEQAELFNIGMEKWKETFRINESEEILQIKQAIKSCTKVFLTLKEKLKNEVEFSNLLDSHIKPFKNIALNVEEQDYFISILFSHIHMFNNRLGIFPNIEYCIFSILSKLIGREGLGSQ